MRKHAKKAFIASVLATLLCVTMLIGTTFAWFTDSVTSGGNVIKSGTLDVGLEYYDDTDSAWKDASTTPIFNYDLWEPGYVQIRKVRISNLGNLALKYMLSILPGDSSAEKLKLAEVIDVYYNVFATEPTGTIDRSTYATALTSAGTLKDLISGTAADSIKGVLLPEGATAPTSGTWYTKEVYAVLALHMQETAGNEYQNLSVGDGFSLKLLATQYTFEEDSFDDQYDANAELPTSVQNASELTAAIASGDPVSLKDNINISSRVSLEGDTTIDGNGKTIKADNNDNRVIDISDSTEPVTINLSNVTIDGSDVKLDSSYARGISMYGNKDITLNASGVNISSPYYAINVAGANENVEINLDNASVASGWAALNIWSKSTINVKDSVLSGTNNKSYDAVGWNNFGTIVMNYDGENRTAGSVLSFENTTIKAEMTTGNQQLLLDLRDDNITVVFKNCTFVSNGTPNGFDDIMFQICEHENITFTNCTFFKNGVQLTNEQVQAAYLKAYPYNDINTCTIVFN